MPNEMPPRFIQQGAAAIEFALLLVILIPLAFGITELGRAFYQYNTLVKATRDGARVLAAGGSTNVGKARCLTVYGTPDCTGEPLLKGLTTGLVQVAYDQQATNGAVTIKVASVTIDKFEFTSLVPYVIDDITFGPVSTTMRQGAP